jgi:hypothetical protein
VDADSPAMPLQWAGSLAQIAASLGAAGWQSSTALHLSSLKMCNGLSKLCNGFSKLCNGFSILCNAFSKLRNGFSKLCNGFSQSSNTK